MKPIFLLGLIGVISLASAGQTPLASGKVRGELDRALEDIDKIHNDFMDILHDIPSVDDLEYSITNQLLEFSDKASMSAGFLLDLLDIQKVLVCKPDVDKTSEIIQKSRGKSWTELRFLDGEVGKYAKRTTKKITAEKANVLQAKIRFILENYYSDRN